MKDTFLNQRLAQHQADTITLLWNDDLLSPSKIGKCFTKNGLRVAVSKENLDGAHALFAQGAKDIRCIGHRVDSFSVEDGHYILDSFDIVSA
jgi:hypothetical protein